MNLTIHQLAQQSAWRAALAEFSPDDDLYFTPEYFAAHERAGLGVAECVEVEEAGARLLLPYLRTPIPGDDRHFDIQSPPGYGGALVRNGSEDFVARAWQSIFAHWRSTPAVAAFLRCHPLLANAASHRPAWQVTHDRDTVALDLRRGLAAALSVPEAAKHRRDASRVGRMGFVTREVEDAAARLEDFIALYEENMTRVGASDAHFFPQDYYRTLVDELGERISLFEVRHDTTGEVVSMGLAMWGPRWGHYHLSATCVQSRGVNFTHALLQGIAEAAERRGCEMLHLGGGRTPAADDVLLRFKSWIGRVALPFHTAGCILDRAAHAELVRAWSLRNAGATPRWFLGYRQPDPAATQPLAAAISS